MSRLDQLAIQSPCSADWAKMDGSDTQRFCVSCEKAVHNLSAMAPCEAEALLARPGPAPCVRFFKRRDGTVVFDLARAAALVATSALAACGAPHYVEMMGDVAYVPETPVAVDGEPTSIPEVEPTDPTTEPTAPIAPTEPTVPVEPTIAYMGGLAPPQAPPPPEE